MNYEIVFSHAKETAIHSTALEYIRSAIEDDKNTDKEKFIEINEIIFEAVSHLEDDFEDE